MSEASRKLAVVAFADIQGYTAVMQNDEQEGTRWLDAFHRITTDVFGAHHGEIVQFYGDGVLVLFRESVEAVNACIESQRQFQAEGVPVRIGMHTGPVLTKGDQIYGDTINVTSRIESIAVAGSVLVSNDVARGLRGHGNITFKTLGSFRFKNVEGQIGVSAVDHPNLAVPRRSELGAGKTQRRSLWQGAVIVLGLLLAVAGVWIFRQDSSGLSDSISSDKNRLVVLSFENQTLDPDLQVFGPMISDWSTKSLIAAGHKNIISATNLGWNEKDHDERMEAIKQAGVGRLLTGRFYRHENELTIHAEVVNVGSGETLQTFDVSGDQGDLRALTNRFLDQILGYWTVRDRASLNSDPPLYKAYKSYLEGLAYFVSDPQKSEGFFWEAIRVDSSFHDPIFSLYQFYLKEGRRPEAAEVFEMLKERSSTFPKWQSLKFEALEARRQRDLFRSAQLSEELYGLDSSDYEAMNAAFNWYVSLNYQGRALAIDDSFDPVLYPHEVEISWRSTDRAFAHYQLGNFREVVRIAETYRKEKIPDALAIMQMQCLLHLDSLAYCRDVFSRYQIEGLYNTSGRATPMDVITIMVCEKLYLLRYHEEIAFYLGKLENYLVEHPEKRAKVLGYQAFFNEDYSTALTYWSEEELILNDWPPWLWPVIEMDKTSRVETARVLSGEDYESAMATLKGPPDLAVTGLIEYNQARIAAAAQQKQLAVKLLEDALRKGYHFFGPSRYRNDAFLRDLHQVPEFIELVTPKTLP